MSDGYGLNADAIRTLAGNGTGLLVTVDHGTTATAEIALARELDLDVVVIPTNMPMIAKAVIANLSVLAWQNSTASSMASSPNAAPIHCTATTTCSPYSSKPKMKKLANA